MKVLWLLFLSLASQSEALQRLSWFGKKWKSQIWNDDLDIGLNPRNTVMRAKPKVFKNLLGLKAQRQGAASGPGFNVQGTAHLKNGKVKLDLTLQGTNHFGDPSATTPSVQTPTTVPTAGSSSAATTRTGPTSVAPPSTTGPTTVGPAGSISTLPSSTTSGPTTSAVTTHPTSAVTKATTPAKSSTQASTATTTGSTTATVSTSGPSTLATTSSSTSITSPSTPTTSLPQSTSASVKTATTVGTSPKTTIPRTNQPSTGPTKANLPGFLSKPFCEKPINVDTKLMAKEILKSHNTYRRTHASPPLHLDEQMTCDAQTFAQEIASKGILQHQKSTILATKRLGENIGMSCAPKLSGPLSYGRILKMAKNVAKRWYDEVCQYNFDKPNAVPSTGHFTEIVWSGARKLGLGFAVGKNARFPEYKCVYVVGRYQPAGNIIGGQRLQMNVKRGNFNMAYCQKRSTALQEDPWDKRNRLNQWYRRNHLNAWDKARRRSQIHSKFHSKHHFHHHSVM